MANGFLKIISKLFLPSRQTERQRVGRCGENAAAKLMRKQGLKILDRNWRCGKLEIDIIAYDKAFDQLIFIEVKTRDEASLAGGYYAAKSHKKSGNIKRAALSYMRRINRNPASWSYDIVEVIVFKGGKAPKISHFENVGF